VGGGGGMTKRAAGWKFGC